MARLSPRKETLRELYLKSGNQCAFPECRALMINDIGEFIGQICHIEAAEPGGQRYNPKQTDEERRDFSNLMLMCYKHHVATNNVELYPVSRLKEIKSSHERKYGDIAATLRKSIDDHTEASDVVHAKSLEYFDQVLEFDLEPEHLEECVEEMK